MGRMETLAAVREKYPQYADMSDEQLGAALAAKYPEYADLAPAKPSEAPGLGTAALNAVKNRVTEALALPGQAVTALVDRVTDPTKRVLPNPLDLIPKPEPRVVLPLVAGGGPVVQSITGMGGEALSQRQEIAAGEREGYDPWQIGIAGAAPLAVATGVRTARALDRTATRVFPGRFRAAQEAALAGAEEVTAQLTPEVRAADLFKQARSGPAVAPEAPVGTREGIDLTLGAAERLRPSVSGRAATLGAAEDLATGRPLDLGEVGRRRAAALTPGPPVAGAVPEAATTARAIATETVPAGRITAILDDLDTTIPKEPGNAALGQVRTFMDKLRGTVKNGVVDLDELMRQRLDLGREIARPGSAPELRALYGHGGKDAKGIIGALEEAAEAGGQGATAARQALDVFKRDAGAARWKGLVEQATTRTNLSGVDTPALNVAKLGTLVEKHADELAAQVGPEGMALIRGFLAKARSLPPTHAATFANRALAVMVGGAAGVGAGSVPIGLGAALLPEIATNVWQVGKNPVWVNQLMAALAQSTRMELMPMVAPSTPVRVGPEARELAGRR